MNVRLNERRFQILQPACTVTHQDHEAAEVTDLQRLLLTPAPLLDSELFPQGTSFRGLPLRTSAPVLDGKLKCLGVSSLHPQKPRADWCWNIKPRSFSSRWDKVWGGGFCSRAPYRVTLSWDWTRDRILTCPTFPLPPLSLLPHQLENPILASGSASGRIQSNKNWPMSIYWAFPIDRTLLFGNTRK